MYKIEKYMRTFKSFSHITIVISILLTTFFASCEKKTNELFPLKNPTNGEVYIDGFTPGMIYAAFGNSVPSAFQVDKDVSYNQSANSMRIDVPVPNDSRGTFAGGTYFLTSGRDLSGYNVLSFWAKATKTATINEIGFGSDLAQNTFQTTLYNVPVNTSWKKYYIPIPDPSKLTNERGMFYFAEGHENGEGYSFWIDEVKFENVGTITRGESVILNGRNTSLTSFKDVDNPISDLFTSFSFPDGTVTNLPTPAAYFSFETSDSTVATVSNRGVVKSLNTGFSVITAKLGDKKAKGSLVVNVKGFLHAPTPTFPSSSVYSIYSDNYTNVPVDFYNGFWQPYQKTLSADFKVSTDNILNYTNFNFVGISFANPTLDATNKSFLSMDVFVPGSVSSGVQFKVTLRDFGPNGVDGGGDDIDKVITFNSSDLASEQWKTLTIPIDISRKSKLGLIILSDSDLGNLPNFYLDNIIIHN
jgi:hypothetical protein